MRILHLVQKPQRRGAEIFAHQLARAQRSLGHQVRTLYLYPYQGPGALPLEDGDCVLAGREDHPLEKVPGVHPGLLGRVLAAMAAFRPDVVQVNGARTVKYGAFARRLNSGWDWRLVYRNIDNPAYWVTDPWHRWFYRTLVMPRMDGIIGVSRTTLAAVQEMYPIKGIAAYIPNGIDLNPLSQAPTRTTAKASLNLPMELPVVLFVGNLTRQKRPDRFLRIVRKVCEEGQPLVGCLLGDGPLRTELETTVRAWKLDNRIHFWGYQEHVAPYMAAADLLLVTSESDGIPAVVLEAAALGVPAVASHVGGMADCVRHGETGLLVDPQDEAGFVAAVRALLATPERRAAMGRRARDWVVEEFEMGQIAQRYLAFYAQVLADKGRCTGVSKAR